MATKFKYIADMLNMAQVPQRLLLKGTIKALSDRETFRDADENLEERIYAGDVFEAILGENAQMPDGHRLKLDKETEEQLEELAKECGKYNYVQITTI